MNTAQGLTHQFDLAEPAQLHGAAALIRSGNVTALAILHRGVQVALPLPKRFRKSDLRLGAETLRDRTSAPIGERIWCQARDVRVSLTATTAGALVRCDVSKIGRQRFDPEVSA